MKKTYTLTQNMIFNTAGTLIYYLCQWAISMVVVRAGTDADVGQLQLAMTITNIFIAVASYNMRPFQVSDVRREYSAGQYVASRAVTCGIALLGCLGYCVLWGYSARSILCVMIYLVYRLNECIADVFHGVDQRWERMDHVAVSLMTRGVTMLLVFFAVLKTTGSLLLSIAAMGVVTLLFTFSYDYSRANQYESVKPVFQRDTLRKLLLACLPSVLSSIFITAVVTVPRQYLEEMRGAELMGYYATVATPLAFIQVLINSMISPTLGAISEALKNNDRSVYLKHVFRLCLFITGVSAAVLAGVYLLGEPVMALLYGEKIRPYISLMPAVVGCTFLFALGAVGQNLLIVLRRMRLILILSAAALLTAVCTGRPMIDAFGANGVSFCIMISYFVFGASSLLIAAFGKNTLSEKKT